MPTSRDRAFAETLTDVAISLDDLCERLDAAKDSRAGGIVAALRDAEFECNELAEQVQS